MYGDQFGESVLYVNMWAHAEGLNYNSALLARLKAEFPSKYMVIPARSL